MLSPWADLVSEDDMQEIGTWTSTSGTVGAVLEFESDTVDGTGAEMPGWLSGALKGAAAGAATGMAAGPYGALVGAAAGGAIGAATASASPPKPPASAPSSASAPSQSAPKPAGSGQSAAQANVIQALQQFAAVIPSLVQLVATTGKAKEIDVSSDGAESTDDASWGPELFEGSWTVP